MILADKRDFKEGFKKHYSSYDILKTGTGSVTSRKLLLAYSVECGLKYLLLKQWNVDNPKKIIIDDTDYRNNVLKSHNLEKMLKELGQMSTFKFPQMKTNHSDNINTDNYHQACRYCVKINDNDRLKEDTYEKELGKIANWIYERM